MTDEEDRRRAADLVAAKWKVVLESDHDLIDPAVPRAAHAHPRLRELSPMVSHGALYLHRCIRFPWTKDVGALFRRAGGGFMVIRNSDHTVLGEPETLEEAIELIVDNLPEGTGPAIDGTADDL